MFRHIASQSITRTPRPAVSHKLLAMTSRRSARLSARNPDNRIAEATAPQDEIKVLVGTGKKRVKAPPAEAAVLTKKANKSAKRKAVVSTTDTAAVTTVPVTPPRKRAKKEPEDRAETITPKKLVRPAHPKATNVPLQTPGGTRILNTYPSELLAQPAGTPASSLAATTTTDNILAHAEAHLRAVDPGLAPLIAQHTCTELLPAALRAPVDPFNALCSSIMGQQVSGAAAAAIKRRFVALFAADEGAAPAPAPASASITTSDPTPTSTSVEPYFPTPAQVASTPLERLRTAGLSARKAEYIQGLAALFASGSITADQLLASSDEQLLATLTGVRGLGRWSVEMFAFFVLKRLDIFSTGDLGVQRGVAVYAGRDVGRLKAKGGGGKWKYMKEDEMLEIANRFVPYRSLFMWYMWRIGDVNLTVMD